MSGLDIRALSAAYGRRAVLDRLALPPIAPGEVVALLGANGAGKSTLLKSLAGVLPARGEAWLGADELFALAPAARARLVGYLPQSLPAASSLVGYEAVEGALRATLPELPRRAREARLAEAFSCLGLTGLALRRLDTLSGGQRQLIALAQVLARAPRLMLLDEPTSALDLRWQLFVLEAVREAARRDDAVALVAIHDINLALRFADRVAVLKDGRVLAADALTPDILAAAYGVAARVETCSLGHRIVVADRALAL